MSDSKGKYIEVNGINVYYEVHGSGKPLVLLHGGTGTGKTNWGAFIPEFSKHFQVIVPDTRGHGKTNNPTRELSYQLLGDDFAAFIGMLGLEKPNIYGWSDGGQIALELGMKDLELGAMIVGGAFHSFDQVNADRFHSWGIEAPGKVNFDQLKEAAPAWVEKLKEQHKDWQKLMVEISHLWLTPFEYTKDDFAKISNPSLVLLGDRDDVISVEVAVNMYRMIPDSELAIIPDGTHRISTEKPDAFSSVALEFLLRHNAE